MHRNIILIGFMGTGKSTVGQALAAALDWTFVDMDERIVEKAGQSIPEIFATHGEAYFRDLESDVLHELAGGAKQVIATGGGAVLRPANREVMLKGGLVVNLKADAETIIHRVKGDANRPLLAGDVEERVRKLLQERRGMYDYAHLAIDTSSMQVDEIVKTILAHAT